MATTAATDPGLALERRTLFIGGEWVPARSDRELRVIDPSTEEQVGFAIEPSRADVDAAVAAARAAFDEGPWPHLSPQERADVLERFADGIERRQEELTRIAVLERGVPIAQAPAFAQIAAGTFRNVAALIRGFAFAEDRTRLDGGISRVLHEPVGVVAGVCPWNGPVPTAAMKIAPAIGAGCTIVVKTAPTTPLGPYLLGDVANEAGVPPGVVNIISAERELSAELVAHPGVDKIAFTGSTAAGKAILEAAAHRVARATMELGGKSAAIVLEDIDLDAGVPMVVASGTRSTGQACWANTRVLVPASRHDEIVEAMAERYRAIRVGSAHDPETEMGPIAFEGQLRRVEGYIALGQEEGARLVTGGGRPEGLDRGWFVEPTLFDGVDNAMRIAREEIFGPVVCVIPYRTEDEAVAIANDTPYGLGGGVFGADLDRAEAVARRMRTGMVGLNGMYLDPNLPFGGFKQSGIGRENGEEGLHGFLEVKTIGRPAGA